ncbi:MAG: hypothetical protein ABW321_02845 [Polyangiales bacterium]
MGGASEELGTGDAAYDGESSGGPVASGSNARDGRARGEGAAGSAAVATQPEGPLNLDDISYALDVEVPPGGEMLRCIYAQIPTDRGVVAVPFVESHYTPGSHHLLAYRSNLTEIPEGNTGVWDCDDGAWQVNMRGSYYEAQRPDEEHRLPDGIAHKFQPGEVLIVQAHYINASDTELKAHVEMTLHPSDPAEVKEEAGTIFFNNARINLPPHGTAETDMNCPLNQDINLALLWSHMHKRGVHFKVETDDAEAIERVGSSTLYEETDWAEPAQKAYPTDPPLVLHAGTNIKFGCKFENKGDATYTFGNSAEHNEMCILHGMYWPRMPNPSETCVLGALGGVFERFRR